MLDRLFWFFPSLGSWAVLAAVVAIALLVFVLLFRGGPRLRRAAGTQWFWVACVVALIAFLIFAPKWGGKSDNDSDEIDELSARVYVTNTYIKQIQQMTLLRVYTDDFVPERLTDMKGKMTGFFIRQVRGYADIKINLEKAEIVLDQTNDTVTLRLPRPYVSRPTMITNFSSTVVKIDRHGNKIATESNLPYTRRWGKLPADILETATRRGQTLIGQKANSAEHINRAKAQAEDLFRTMLMGFGKTVKIEWK